MSAAVGLETSHRVPRGSQDRQYYPPERAPFDGMTAGQHQISTRQRITNAKRRFPTVRMEDQRDTARHACLDQRVRDEKSRHHQPDRGVAIPAQRLMDRQTTKNRGENHGDQDRCAAGIGCKYECSDWLPQRYRADASPTGLIDAGRGTRIVIARYRAGERGPLNSRRRKVCSGLLTPQPCKLNPPSSHGIAA